MLKVSIIPLDVWDTRLIFMDALCLHGVHVLADIPSQILASLVAAVITSDSLMVGVLRARHHLQLASQYKNIWWYSLSNVTVVVHKMDSFCQHLRYCHKAATLCLVHKAQQDNLSSGLLTPLSTLAQLNLLFILELICATSSVCHLTKVYMNMLMIDWVRCWSCQHGINYMRRPCQKHGEGCFWPLLLTPTTEGYKRYENLRHKCVI